MNRILLAFTATVMLVVPVYAAPTRQIIGAEQDHSIIQTGDCEHFYKTTFTNFPAQVTDQEQREIPLDGIDKLHVTASQEGGVSIRGWHKPNARLIVCRSAAAETRAQALRVLRAIHVSHINGEIGARGLPDNDAQTWWVNMILYVPRRASVEVRASNGGVAIRNMAGHVTAHATSGGISVAQSSGNYKITTESGGITLDRITGEVEAVSREGAIALKVSPADLPTIEAKTAAAGNILCTFKECEGGLGAWAADRKSLRIRGGLAHIRLSTTGAQILIGPVTY
jgi:hypothetical protein